MKKNKIKEGFIKFIKPNRLNLTIFGLFIVFFIFLYYYMGYCGPEEGADYLVPRCDIYETFYNIIMILVSPALVLELIFGRNPPKQIELFLMKVFWLYLIIFYYLLSCFIAYSIKRCIIYIYKIRRKHKKVGKRGKLIILLLFFTAFVTTVSAIPSDTNLSNNIMNVSINVYEMNNLKIRFRPYIYEEGDTFNDFTYAVNQHSNFIQKVFPLSDTGLNTSSNSSIIIASWWSKIFAKLTEGSSLVNNFYKSALLEGKPYDKFVGIVPNNFFSRINSTAIGVMNPSNPRAALVTEAYFKTSAHEVAHTYGLCDEYNRTTFQEQDENKTADNGGCPNGDADEDGSLDARCLDTFNNYDGCPVEDNGIIIDLFFGGGPPYDLTNLMGPNWEGIWIDNESYNVLFDDLRITNNPPIFTPDPVVVVSGYVNKSFDVILDNFYVINGGVLSNQSEYQSGNFTFETRDESNNLLFNISVKPIFEVRNLNGDSIETNTSFFIFVVPFQNISKLSFMINNTLENERNVTPNTPKVNVTYPKGGETFKYPFNITWNASDADGDTLAYAILISSDNGQTYSTLSIDLNTTYFEVNNGWVEEGSNYKIKVLATDGINTGYNFSSGTFTVIPPTKFSLKNNSGNTIAYFNSNGNLFLKNTLKQSATPADTADDEFLLRDDSNTVVAKINSTGYMEIKGTLAQNQGSLTDPPGDDFLIKDGNNVVAYINESGYMFLKGSLYENYG